MPKKVNLIGNEYGELKVVAKAEQKDTGGKTMYVCECSCGNKNFVVRGTNLTPKAGEKVGRVTSCGCQKSIGEANITKILVASGRTFAREYTFGDLVDKGKLRFDFAVMTAENELDYLIEFDGNQHASAGSGWNTEEAHANTQRRDNMKNEYCKLHNITLIRIPYAERDNINLEMISRGSRYEM